MSYSTVVLATNFGAFSSSKISSPKSLKAGFTSDGDGVGVVVGVIRELMT